MTDFLSMTAGQVEALPEAKAEEVLDAWVKAKKAELPQTLALSSSKAHAKLAKKALYRLQSSGVSVAAPEAPKAGPSIDFSIKNDFPAVLSMQLGTGERAFLFASPMRGGGLEVFQGLVHDEFGIAQMGSEAANRNLYRKRMKQLEEDPEARVMLVPWERMKLELGRAMALNERTKTDYGDDIEQALHRLGVQKQDPDFPVPPLEADDAARRAEGASLHDTFEIAQWMPSEKDLIVLTQQVDAIKNGPLPLSDEQKTQKCEQLARKLADEIFTAPVRQLYARRLWYTAEVMDAQKRVEDAAKARAEARRLAHETEPSLFAQQLFVKVLATLANKPSVAAALGLTPPAP